MSKDAFIPQGYEAPVNAGGYTKLELGDNLFRILSNPFMLWLSWTDGQPSRVPYDPKNKPAKGAGQKDSVKHSWGLIVWNYKTKQIEVFELDKQDIINGLVSYAQNPKWGHPKLYDIVINKTGSGLETEYKLVVEPHSDPSKEIVDAFIANPIDLRQLLVKDGNPFLQSAPAAAPQGVPVPQDVKPATPEQAFGATPQWVAGQPIPEGFEDNGAGGIKKKMPF
ncbi:hypothetical protein KAU11_08930 [Candidatus Babeliales bacterium]|nr:hypothetical protein [Candidatus Babeliales bacterium]